MFEKIKKYKGLAVLAAILSAGGAAAIGCGPGYGESSIVGTEEEFKEDVTDIKFDVEYDSHPYSKTCLIDSDSDNYGIKEGNLFVDWDEPCPEGYKALEPPFDCNDKIKSINPGEYEKCNNIDDNCNKLIDEGLEQKCMTGCGEGKSICVEGKYTECNSQIPTEEICDDYDNDCDGLVDENLDQECQTVCGNGMVRCINGVLNPCNAPEPEEEVCDGYDNNCNGIVDEIEGCCTPGEKKDLVPCPPQPYTFAFLIDNSGSMDDNDPDDIRYMGLHLFVEYMDTDDKASVIPFADYAKESCGFTYNSNSLEKCISSAQSTDLGGGTDIGAALTHGLNMIEPQSGLRTILLLTDGNATYDADYFKELAEEKGIIIYTLGLGSQVDSNNLSQTATDTGAYYFISNADDILDVYNEIMTIIKYSSWKECSWDKQWIETAGKCN